MLVCLLSQGLGKDLAKCMNKKQKKKKKRVHNFETNTGCDTQLINYSLMVELI